MKDSIPNIPGATDISLILKYCPYVYLRVSGPMTMVMVMII
jgi:hypothetical protein